MVNIKGEAAATGINSATRRGTFSRYLQASQRKIRRNFNATLLTIREKRTRTLLVDCDEDRLKTAVRKVTATSRERWKNEWHENEAKNLFISKESCTKSLELRKERSSRENRKNCTSLVASDRSYRLLSQ